MKLRELSKPKNSRPLWIGDGGCYDGIGAVTPDGKMPDNITCKQPKVVVGLVIVARKDSEMKGKDVL